MTDQTAKGRALSWRDGKSGPLAGLLYLSLAVALIGAAAFALSFIGVNQAARPYFGAVAWVIPLLGDLAIGVFTAFSIAAELAGLSSPTARWSSRLLIGFTVFANVAHEPGIYGRVLHAAPPLIWVLIVTTFEHLVRRMVGLNSPTRIEGLRKSLWLLRPLGTWRLWRAMRIHQIGTYREALDRDAARAAVVGRLRVSHGLLWRQKAPLAERIALRLQGRDPAGVAAILADHADTAALLAAPADSALRPLDPVVYPPDERPVLSPFTTLVGPFSGGANALPPGQVPAGPANGSANAENERDAAVRLRREGLSIGRIANRLGRSKSWVHGVVAGPEVKHANGSKV
jgi:hypothetical protein